MAQAAVDRQGELELRRRLLEDFEFYAEHCLTIRPKTGSNIPLRLNAAQKYIHEKIEEQRRETGRVRAIILKGRQQGSSTYVEGRFMWRVTHSYGVQAFILTHEDDATKNLFNMAKRYYENLPLEVRPEKERSNDKTLTFKRLDSSYAVGTAGNKAVGRSQTNQFFHGSEVAYWNNAADHAKGVLQTIPDMDGTEVIYESTANGMGNFFHEQWKAAERGESDFIAIFVPWFIQMEYTRKVDETFELTDDEAILANNYGLSAGQIAWRRAKILELTTPQTDGETAFKQEYPMNAAEAFQVSGSKSSLINSAMCEKARKHVAPVGATHMVGIDPSRGGDRFAAIRRAGSKAWGYDRWSGDEVKTLGQKVAICKEILDTVDPVTGTKPDVMYVDADGADLVDRLHELGYENVIAVGFGEATLYPDKYNNKRSEMWGELGEWLADEAIQAEIPDSDEVQADLCASPYRRDTRDRKCMVPKDDIRKEFGFSPDAGDALCLTFCGRKIIGKAPVVIDFESAF